MGMIKIDVPGDVNLKFKVESLEVINKIIQIMKNTGSGIKKISKGSEDDIVGIWKDRFDEKISSEKIQKELREQEWKRY